MGKCWLMAAAAALLCGACGPPALAADDASPPKPTQAPAEKAAAKEEPAEPFKLAGPLTFQLEEAPAFDKVEIDGRTVQRNFQWQYARCSGEPSKAVKAYPKFASPQPLYGELRLDGHMYDPTQGRAVYFVLDQSGEEPKPAAEKKEEAKEGKKAASQPPVRFQNDAAKYDRLYVDRNGDGDLTNDGVLKPGERLPLEGLFGQPGQQAFETFSLAVDYGPPTGVKPFEMIAAVALAQRGTGILLCGVPHCRRGKIKIGTQEFVADLAQTRILSGRYDRPFVALRLTPLGEATKTTRLLQASLSGYLGQMRQIDGQWIVTAASATGDQLTIAPYRGDLGILEIGPGGRAITELGIAGMLAARDTIVMLGDSQLGGQAVLPRRLELPVGEYLPAYLAVQYGRLRFNCRALTDDASKPPLYSIKIQKDKPYVLSFSGKPAVDFSSPPREASFQPGQSVMLRAMLNEPYERIQITGLYDATKKEDAAKPPAGDQKVTVARPVRLDPTIAIRNASGAVVAEGKMPFG